MGDDADARRMAEYLALSEEMRGGLGTNGSGALGNALRDTVALFRSAEVPYALFGALAVVQYVEEERSTMDVDVVSGPQWMERIRGLAVRHNFAELPADAEARIVRFRHRDGAQVDVIFDEKGFADLADARTVQVPGIGPVRVASAMDVAFSKLRTQEASWRRLPEKRAMDYADLINLLRHNEGLGGQLAARLRSRRGAGAETPRELLGILQKACREAGLPPPAATSRRRGALWIVLAAVCALAALALAVWRLAAGT